MINRACCCADLATDELRADTQHCALLAAVFDAMDAPAVAVDVSWNIVIVNRAARRLFRLDNASTSADRLPEQVRNCLKDGTAPYAREDLPLVRAARGIVVEDEEAVVQLDDERHHLLIRARPVLSPCGGQLGAVAVYRDVTAYRRAVGNLNERLKEQSCLFRLTRAMSCQRDLDPLFQEIAATLPDAFQFPHLTRVELTYKGRRYTTPGSSSQTRCFYAPLTVNHTRQGELRVWYPETVELLSEEITLLDAVVWILCESLSRRESEQSRTFAMRAMAVEQSRRDALLNSLDVGVIAVDPDGNLITINAAGERVLGLSMAEAVGAPLLDFVARSPFEQPLRDCLEQQDHFHAAGMVRQGDGKAATYWSCGSAPIYDHEQNRLGTLLLLRDVTEQARSDELKTEFISLVSHELRTPLTVLRTYADTIARGYLGQVNDEQKEGLETILGQVAALEQHVGRLLMLSKLEAGKERLSPQTFNLVEFVQERIKTFALLAQERRLTIHLHNRLADGWICVDAEKLAQVLDNLISNALKFTPPPGDITILLRDETPDLVMVAVADSGIGIPLEYRSKVFDKFEQVDFHMTRKTGGTGLGLPIAKSIVEAHGGTIWIDDNPGGGTILRFTLPRAQDCGEPPNESPPARHTHERDHSNAR